MFEFQTTIILHPHYNLASPKLNIYFTVFVWKNGMYNIVGMILLRVLSKLINI